MLQRRQRTKSLLVKKKIQNLMHDPDFLEYCRQEIRNMVSNGMNINDIHNVVDIVNYIITKEYKHTIPREIIMDVLEAVIIELLHQYGIDITDEMYQEILSCLYHITHNKTCLHKEVI